MTTLWKTLLLLSIIYCCCSVEAKPSSSSSSSAPAANKKPKSYLLKKPQCTEKRQKHLESEMAKALPIGGQSNRRFPETVAEVQVYCREFNRLVAQNEAFFKECYSKTIRDYANILIYSTKRNLRKYCGKKGSRVVKEMLKLAPCANRHFRSTKANTEAISCYRRYVNATSQLVNIADDSRKIPHACCLFSEAIACAEEVMGGINCLRPHIPTLMDYFRTGTSSITDIMCGDYNAATDACAKLGPPPAPLRPNTKKYLTPMALLIDLMESITEFTPTPSLGGSGGF